MSLSDEESKIVIGLETEKRLSLFTTSDHEGAK